MAEEWWPNPPSFPTKGSAHTAHLLGHVQPMSNMVDPAGASLQRGRAGLGYVDPMNPATKRARRPVALDPQAHSSAHAMVLVWNAGFLDREARLDALSLIHI